MTEACNNENLGIKTKFKIKNQNSPSTPLINSTHRAQTISKKKKKFLDSEAYFVFKTGKIKGISTSLMFQYQSIVHHLGMEFLTQFKCLL